MTLLCGVCGNQIQSHMVEERRGSHYTEHYIDVEEILHEDLGKILKIMPTGALNQKLDEVQKQRESSIINNAFLKTFKVLPYNITEVDLMSSASLRGLIGNLQKVYKDAEDNKISVNSVEKLGRHTNWKWNRLHIPEVDVCKDCFYKFERHVGIVTLGYLDRNIPNLKLAEVNKDIWDDICGCVVKASFDDY